MKSEEALAICIRTLERLQEVCALHGACEYVECGGRIARETLKEIGIVGGGL